MTALTVLTTFKQYSQPFGSLCLGNLFSNSVHSLQRSSGLPFRRKAKGRKSMYYWTFWLAQTDAVGHNITT